MPAGRPSAYTPEKARLACDLIESTPGSLEDAFAARDDLPTLRTILNWERDHAEFLPMLHRAREIRAHIVAESCLAIADNTANDTIYKTSRNGEEYESANSEWINRSRLRFEARKWVAKTLNQGVYGEKQALNLGGQPGNPVKTETAAIHVDADSLTADERTALMRILHRDLQGG